MVSTRHGTCPTRGRLLSGEPPMAWFLLSDSLWPSARGRYIVDGEMGSGVQRIPSWRDAPLRDRLERREHRAHVDAVPAVRSRKPFIDAVLRELCSPAVERMPCVPW